MAGGLGLHFAERSESSSARPRIWPLEIWPLGSNRSEHATGTPPHDRRSRRSLLRVLGVWEGAAVGIGVAIGGGIFRTPGYVAGFLDAPWKILTAWTVGGLIVLGDSLILSELATRMPRAGGWYVYIEKGWGRFPAFVYGWTYMLVVDPASSAALVVILGEYLSSLLGLSPGGGRLFAIVVTLGLFLLSLAGIRLGSRVQDALTYTKLAALVAVGVLALVVPRIPAAPASPPAGSSAGAGLLPPVPPAAPVPGSIPSALLAFGLALQGVLWTFEGYSNTTTMSEESLEPRRTLPRALILGSAALGVTYLLVNASYLHVLGRTALAASQLPAADLAHRVFGGGGTVVFLLIAILAALGSLNGAALSAPRVAYALARSRLAPEPFTRVTRLGTPDLATLWFALAWSAYASLGSVEGLIAVSIFVGALANVAVTATLFVHRLRDRRRAEPETGSIFFAPLYPALPITMLVLWSAFAGAVLYDQGWKVGYGLGATALAALAYLAGPARRGGRR